ncbi:MAG: hypothetical protein EOO45_08365 [Flavobacterium sp.]|nr:MAG: hypothetical protein EOO45_08365 [Flavobacterium sp.]
MARQLRCPEGEEGLKMEDLKNRKCGNPLMIAKLKFVIRLLISCCFCLILISCTWDNYIDNKIYKTLKNEKVQFIDLNDYVDVDWDTAYLFQIPLSNDEIENIINTRYSHYVEFTLPFIFLKGDKVVYYENIPSNIEKLREGTLVYKGLFNEDKFIKVGIENSKLKAKIVKEGELEFVLIE